MTSVLIFRGNSPSSVSSCLPAPAWLSFPPPCSSCNDVFRTLLAIFVLPSCFPLLVFLIILFFYSLHWTVRLADHWKARRYARSHLHGNSPQSECVSSPGRPTAHRDCSITLAIILSWQFQWCINVKKTYLKFSWAESVESDLLNDLIDSV